MNRKIEPRLIVTYIVITVASPAFSQSGYHLPIVPGEKKRFQVIIEAQPPTPVHSFQAGIDAPVLEKLHMMVPEQAGRRRKSKFFPTEEKIVHVLEKRRGIDHPVVTDQKTDHPLELEG